MENFVPKKLVLSNINGGKKYKNGDAISANTINDPIEAVAFVQSLTENTPTISNDDTGKPSISIDETNDGKGVRFNFVNVATPISQTTGDSATMAMSQKATTDTFKKVFNSEDDGTISTLKESALPLKFFNETYSNALKGNVGGTAIRIDDVSPLSDSVEVNVSGVSNPESVTVTRFGKNLLNPQYFIDRYPTIVNSGYTRQGVTIKYIPEEDCWELNGSAEATVDQYGVQLVPNKFSFGNLNGKYITGSVEYVSGNIIGEPDEDTVGSSVSIGFSNNADGTGYGAQLVFDIKTTNTQKTIMAYRDYFALYWLAINRGQTFENYRFRLQLEISDTATEYEKCTQESFTPDSNGNLEITGLRPTTTLLTNNASAYLLTNYTRDINAAINGTTETQPLATIDYVNTAVANAKPKLFKHIFNVSGVPISSADMADMFILFEIVDTTETAIVKDNDPSSLLAYFTAKNYNGKRLSVTGYAMFNDLKQCPVISLATSGTLEVGCFTSTNTVAYTPLIYDGAVWAFNETVIEI